MPSMSTVLKLRRSATITEATYSRRIEQQCSEGFTTVRLKLFEQAAQVEVDDVGSGYEIA